MSRTTSYFSISTAMACDSSTPVFSWSFIGAYIATLKTGEALGEATIRDGYQRFKAEKHGQELADIAKGHGLETAALQAFMDGILLRMIFDGEKLGDLMAPLDLAWKARTQKELALMDELTRSCANAPKVATSQDSARMSNKVKTTTPIRVATRNHNAFLKELGKRLMPAVE